MIKQLVTLVAVVLFTLPAFGQGKELTLEDAVMEQ